MKRIVAVLIGLVSVVALTLPAGAVSVVTKETLKSWMESGPVAVLDARQGRDWRSSEFKIKGAHRTAPADFTDWKAQFSKDQKLVIYCA